MSTAAEIRIRPSRQADRGALQRLAERDSTALDSDSYLLAEVDGAPRAALGLRRRAVTADPFEPTAHLIAMLERAEL